MGRSRRPHLNVFVVENLCRVLSDGEAIKCYLGDGEWERQCKSSPLYWMHWIWLPSLCAFCVEYVIILQRNMLCKGGKGNKNVFYCSVVAGKKRDSLSFRRVVDSNSQVIQQRQMGCSRHPHLYVFIFENLCRGLSGERGSH
ncbi:hypothetical protein CEXT_35861 [Caerostris extrusa]|uniref:Uncharacterized protein n=1 Tax=Caerostris extrusa TaxID=172846 RepID=A0AAV4PBE4_CAEEX|nr:hypothetical protein CEXT_35861 [Caerostris extrusa]